MALSLIFTRHLGIPWLFPERFGTDMVHNVMIPRNMNHPDDVVQTTSQLGLQVRGWTHLDKDTGDECLCLFSGDVCCLVTLEGLKFLVEHVPRA